MIAKLLESGWAEMAYEDDEARILKIRDQKGEPPAEAKDRRAADRRRIKTTCRRGKSGKRQCDGKCKR